MHGNTADTTCDTSIDPTNSNQYIVWAIGGLGETAFKHFLRADGKPCCLYFVAYQDKVRNTIIENILMHAGDSTIHLERTPEDQCVGVDLVCDSCDPFENENITVTDNATFSFTIGPSGNERGYMGITGTIMFLYNCDSFSDLLLIFIIN